KSFTKSNIKKLDLFLKKYFIFQFRWDDTLNQKMINNVMIYCLLLRLINIIYKWGSRSL
ncbi:unnamed protein product, partial [Musa acuminata var. zebrina]